ncbi:hypothetical protein HNR73_001772 [Phytomonospora endophytica]|uniref:Uncharacterized protein n=1 Tax=Phytomonospora endophytica TaxID=714109 RepID=A0A841FK30_9ACTN|nr:hypothetical protein [Phytomonospora endophytica]
MRNDAPVARETGTARRLADDERPEKGGAA